MVGREHEVHDGDAIIVGVSEFRVQIVAPPVAPAAGTKCRWCKGSAKVVTQK